MHHDHRVWMVTAAAALAAAVVVAGCPAASGADGSDEVAILPQKIVLRGPEARQPFLIERFRDALAAGAITDEVTAATSDPTVAIVENGIVRPSGDGRTTLQAVVNGATLTAEVEVSDFDQPFAWRFREHVEAVLTKAGCNSGACHGAAAGKSGFKLSLRGYDPDGDFWAITRHARGRRIVPADPARSLLLLKPTGLVRHGGGFRLDPASREYRVLSEWIAAGTPAPQPTDPSVERLEILPDACILAAEDRQPLLVRAHYSDGRVEDVTNWAKYTSSNESVARVDDKGNLEVVGQGEGAITAWFASKVVVATITVPYSQQVDPQQFAGADDVGFIDRLVLDKLRRLNLPPSERCTDHEFIRRAFLDTLGILPAIDDVETFVADSEPAKRDELIDRLLERPEFVDYWTYKWSDLLLVNSETLPPAAMWSFSNWIRNHVATNTPWDVVARELLTAAGGTLENGATNFYVLHVDPLDLAETTTVAFLGMSINCARCHNHPLEKWTNNQYYAMANLFARVRTKNGASDADRTVFSAPEGDVVQPLTGRPQSPAPLDGRPLALDAPGDRRAALADWLTSPENPYFSRAIVNRVWANFLGVGLVEPVDDMRLTNPASNEPLLAELARFLAENQFDLRTLMRAILRSETYQRTSRALPENAADTRFYARYYPRRLMAEVLLDAISQVTEVPTEFPNYPSGWRALQLPDSKVESYFLTTFGRPERAITCECERTHEPSMVQVLHLSNGDILNKKIAAPTSRLSRDLSAGREISEIIESLYLASLARPPSDEQRLQLLELIEAAPEAQRREALEDLYWSVLSSTEFLFNH